MVSLSLLLQSEWLYLSAPKVGGFYLNKLTGETRRNIGLPEGRYVYMYMYLIYMYMYCSVICIYNFICTFCLYMYVNTVLAKCKFTQKSYNNSSP